MNNFKPCGECTACCTWLSASIFGWEIGEGRSCKFLECNGCGIHKIRADVCKNFQCAWTQHLLPEEMRPDKCNVLVTVDISEEFLRAFPINNTEINTEVKQYLQEWSEKMNTPVFILD